MFSSVSACVPNSQVVTSFVSSQQQLLDINANIQVSVNGTLSNVRPILLANGDIVQATVTTSNVYLGYVNYEYTLNNTKNYFAVVNKNNYTPTVKVSDQGKRWFNYAPDRLLISYYRGLDNFQRPLGYGKRIVDISQTHIVLDHINNAVCFYSKSQEQITRVNLPSGPIAYQKVNYTESGVTRTEAIILCSDKRIYRIRFDNRYLSGDEYSPTVIPVELADNLWFEQDLPTGESFIESRRNAIRAKTRPPTTALDISTNYIWIGGYDAIYVLSRSFQQLNKIDLAGQSIIDIAYFNNDAYALGRDGKLFYISRIAGTATQVFQKVSLGSPCNYQGNKVIVPDPDSQRLLIFINSSGTYTTVSTPDFAPAYARVFDGAVWVTGHDSNRVLKFNSNLTAYETYYFNNKVTLVSVADDSILATHYLQNFVVLDLTGIKKVIPVELVSKTGPLTHIGTEPVQLTMLGEENLVPQPGPGITAWVNGISGEAAKTGDYLGASFRAEKNGDYRSYVVLGDSAFDYDVTVRSSTVSSDYFSSGVVALNRLSGILGVYIPPDDGTLDVGRTGPIPLGFDLNMNGRLYNQFYVTTNGYITFEDSTPYSATTFAGHGTAPVLYVDPGNLIQSGAVNNVDPLNIYYRLDSGETPGVYFRTGTQGNFKYFRVRWVGTEFQANLEGASTTTVANISNWGQIPFSYVDGIQANMYVSGSGITVSTKVTDVYSFYQVADVVKIDQLDNKIYIDNTSGAIYPKYTRISGGSGIADVVNTYSNTAITSNILSVSSNVLILQSNLSVVNDTFVAVLTNTSNAPVRISGIVSSTYSTDTITCANIIDNNKFAVSAADYIKVYTGQNVLGSNIPATTILTKTIADEQYIITLAANHSLIVGETISATKTEVVFDNVLPVNLSLYAPARFEQASITISNVSSFVSGNVGNITAFGFFAVVNSNVSLPSGTTLLFANDYAAPAKTYEVGFYQGINYQYLEYFYDSNNHSSTANIGIVSDDLVISQQTNTNTSVVFSSDLSSGRWGYLGAGSFNYDPLGFVPRGVNYIRSVVGDNTQDRIEIYFDRNLTANSNVLIAADYGYLTVNSAVYTGDSSISEGAVISLTAPFNTSLRPVAPMISIGDYQFAVPMVSRNTALPISTIYVYENQNPNTLISANVTIPVSGTYYFPNYFRNPSAQLSTDLEYQRTRSGNTVTLTGLYHELLAGDQITVLRQLTPRGLYNFVDVDIVGPVHIKLRWQTSAGAIYNQMNFGTLTNPFTRLEEFLDDPLPGDNDYYYTDGYVSTANITLTSNSNIQGTLYVDVPESRLVYNGAVITNLVSGVVTGGNIAIQRRILNYQQANVDLYQIKYDSVTSTNVYIPVGTWSINNKPIIGSANVGKTTIRTYSAISDIEDNYNSVNSTLIENILPSALSLLSNISNELDVAGTSIQQTVESNLGIYNQLQFMPDIGFNSQQPISFTNFSLESLFDITNSIAFESLPTQISSASTFITNPSLDVHRTPAATLSTTSIDPFIASSVAYIESTINEYLEKVFSNFNLRFNSELERIKTINKFNQTPEFLANLSSVAIAMMGQNDNTSSILNLDSPANLEIRSSKIFSSIDSRLDYDINYLYTAMISDAVDNKTILTYSLARSFDLGKKILLSNLQSNFTAMRNEVISNLLSALENNAGTLTLGLDSDIENNGASFNIDAIQSELETVQASVLKTISNELEHIYSIIENQSQAFLQSFGQIAQIQLTSAIESTTNRLIGTLQELREDITSSFVFAITANDNINSYTVLLHEIGQQIEGLTNQLTQVITTSLDEQRTLLSDSFDIVKESIYSQLDIPTEYQLTLDTTHIRHMLSTDVPVSRNLIEYLPIAIKDTAFNLISTSLVATNDPLNLNLYSITPVADKKNIISLRGDVVQLLTNYIYMLAEFQYYAPNSYPVQFEPNFEIKNYQFSTMNPTLLTDIAWISDDITKHGTFKTKISIWADNGRAGDKITNMGTPPNRGPFVHYTKEYNYLPGGYTNGGDASAMAVKYVAASAFQIVGTDYWNYRIYFNGKHYCVPRKGTVFPIRWYIRGG